LIILLSIGCDALKKEGGSFSVKFVWPENDKPDFSEGYNVWVEMQEWVNGDVQNVKTHLKEGPVAFSKEGRASFKLEGLTYGKNRSIIVEVRKTESEQDRVLYYGVSGLFDFEPGKKTEVSVEMNLTSTPGTEEGVSVFSIQIYKDGNEVKSVSQNRVDIRVQNVTGEKIVFSNRLELLDVQLNDPGKDYSGAEIIDFLSMTELEDGSFEYEGWNLLEGIDETENNDGQKVVYAKVLDSLGYRSEMAYAGVDLDTSPPKVINSAVSPSGNPGLANIGADIVVRFMLSEPVVEFNFNDDGLDFQDNSTGVDKIYIYKVTENDEEGTVYNFSVSAKDEAGNELHDFSLGSVKIDSAPPEITSFSVSKEKVKMGEDFSVEFDVSEEILSLEVLVGSKSIADNCKLKEDTLLSYICLHTANKDGDEGDGIKQISIQIADLAGNPNTQTLKEDGAPITIEYDTTHPVLISPVVIPQPKLNSYNDSFQIRFSFSEKVRFDESFVFSVVTENGDDMINDFSCESINSEDQSFVCVKTFASEDESEGEYSFFVDVYDLSGNRLPQDGVKNKITSVQVDRLVPEITIEQLNPDKINNETESVEVVVKVSERVGEEDPVIKFGTNIVVNTPESFNSQRTEFLYKVTHLQMLYDGSQKMDVSATDTFGNTGEISRGNIHIDRTLPTVVDSTLNRETGRLSEEIVATVTFSESMKEGTVKLEDEGLGFVLDEEDSSSQIFIYRYLVVESDQGEREKSYSVSIIGDDKFDNRIMSPHLIGSVEIDLTPPSSELKDFVLTTATSDFYDINGLPAVSHYQPGIEFSFTVEGASQLGREPEVSIGQEPAASFNCIGNGDGMDCSGTYIVSGGESEGTKIIGVFLFDEAGNFAEHYPGAVVFDFTGPRLVSTLIQRQPDYAPARNSFNKIQYFSPKDPFTDSDVTMKMTMYSDEEISTDFDVEISDLPCKTAPFVVSEHSISGNTVSYSGLTEDCEGTYTPSIKWRDVLGNESEQISDWSASVVIDPPDPFHVDRDYMIYRRKPLGSINEGSNPYYSIQCNHCVNSSDIKHILFYTATGLLAGSRSVTGDSFYLKDLAGGDVPVLYVNPVSFSGNKIPVKTSSGDPLDISSILDPVPNVIWTMNMHNKNTGMLWPNPSSFYNEEVETDVLPAMAFSRFYAERRNGINPGYYTDDPYLDYTLFHSGYAYSFNPQRNEVVAFGGESFAEIPGELHYYSDTVKWNGSRWTIVEIPGIKPGARANGSMVFESSRNRHLLFGGSKYTVEWQYFNDTWVFDGENWIKLFISSPSSRDHAAMAYDPMRKVTVLIGGIYDHSPVSPETWEFDGESWNEVVLSDPESDGNPSDGYGNMVYHPVSGKMIYHDSYNGETWAYDGSSWEFLDSGGLLCKGARMVYEQSSGDILFYGGKNGAVYLTSSYRFNGESWTADISIDPVAGHIMWYSHSDETTYIAAGVTGNFTYPEDIFKYSGNMVQKESSYIAGTARSALAYNRKDKKIYFFGGERYIQGSGMWSDSRLFGTIADKHKNVIGMTAGPSPMSNHDMIYHLKDKSLMVFESETLWRYKDDSWGVVNSNGPKEFDVYKMVYDESLEQIILVLKTPPKDGVGVVETWIYDGLNWSEISSVSQPYVDSKNGLALTYLSKTSKVYAFSYSPMMPFTMEFDGTSWNTVTITDPEMDGSPVSSDYAVFVSLDNNESSILINRNRESGELEFWEFDGFSYSRIDSPGIIGRYAYNAVYSEEEKGIYLLGGKKFKDEDSATVEDWYFVKIPRFNKPYQKYVVPLDYASIPEGSALQKIDFTWIGGGTTEIGEITTQGIELYSWIYGGWESQLFGTGSYSEHSPVSLSITDPLMLDMMTMSVERSVMFKAEPVMVENSSENGADVSASSVEIDVYYNIEGKRTVSPSVVEKYAFGDTPMSWYDAREYCLQMGHDLVTIDSYKDFEIILSDSKYMPGDYWIGIYDFFKPGDWRKVDGIQFWNGDYSGQATNDSFISWAIKQPSGLTNYNCGYMDSEGFWVAEDCNETKKFICELRTGNYVISTDSLDYNVAQLKCASLDLNLVKIDGAFENKDLVDRFSGSVDVWIGYSDSDKDGFWRWNSGLLGWIGDSGGIPYYYNNWDFGYPVSTANYDYAYIKMSGDKKWRNTSSGNLKRYICENDESAQVCSLNGENCKENESCCSNLCSEYFQRCVSCLENGDSSCEQPSQCCDNICNTDTNICVNCLDPGEYTCSSYKDCCGKFDSCLSGKCCRGLNLECKSTTECCTGLQCGYGEECRKTYGAKCSSDSECATNVCATSKCACKPLTMSCSDNFECCSGTCSKGSCVCASDYGICLTNEDCCSNNCSRGLCKP
jgi:hypothetical protein